MVDDVVLYREEALSAIRLREELMIEESTYMET